MVKNNNLYYIYSDYLGTPRTLTDTNNNVVWQWDNIDPFGSNLPSIQTVEFNFRLPGQYFDSETGLHYNYFRTYNPQTGKYISSDPIGLDGGTNTYGYVDGNPLSGTDELGLMQLNAYGTLRSEFIEELDEVYKNGHRIKVFSVYLFTDKGTRIAATYRISANPKGYDYTANCHGWTFAKGGFWINDDQVEIVLNEEYKVVDRVDMQPGDIVVYTVPIKGNVKHSVTVVRGEDGKLVGFGKDATQPHTYNQEISSKPYNYHSATILRKINK